MLLDPFLSKARRIGLCAILMEYEVVSQQAFTVLDQLRKQIIHVKICIHLHLLWHKVKPSLASKAHSCRHHDVRRELGSLDLEASWINITFLPLDQTRLFWLFTGGLTSRCSNTSYTC